MKIAFYTPTLMLGGYEKVVVNYANAFSNSHEITILCGKAEGELLESIADSINVVDFQARARKVLPELIKWLRKNQLDILYVPFVTFTAMAIIAKKISGSKAIIYSAQHGFEKNLKFGMNQILRHVVKRADVLIAVSSSVADYDSKRLHINRNRYYILDNPVLDYPYESKKIDCEWLMNSDTSVIAVAGRLAYDKHIEIPIKIVAEAVREKDIKLLILGEGAERTKLEQLTKELEIEDKVHFMGYVNNPVSYLQFCDIFMQTSEIESFGNGVVEALYAELPIVTTDCGGPIDIIEGDKYGVNIGAYDAPDVVQKGVKAVLGILNSEYKFEGMREKALRYVAANLEEQFLEPYYECIKKN